MPDERVDNTLMLLMLLAFCCECEDEEPPLECSAESKTFRRFQRPRNLFFFFFFFFFELGRRREEE